MKYPDTGAGRLQYPDDSSIRTTPVSGRLQYPDDSSILTAYYESTMSNRQNVLFLCTHNSARSQMAEGLLREKYGDRFQVFSAGTQATQVKEQAVRVLAEKGVDAGGHSSKTIDAIASEDMDIVVTVCDSARETCPFLPGRIATIHHSFPDPSQEGETEEENLNAFRRVRDEISSWIDSEFSPGSRFGSGVGGS